ncbi:MAG: GNAT family N-acetyltransferase [Bacteroidetes bacterium]|nr:GNAT family N-acetyltransferase [Bacteroidota bacterium]
MAVFKGTEYTVLETERMRLMEVSPAMAETLFTKSTDDEIVELLTLESMEDFEVDRQNFLRGITTYRTSFCNFILIDKVRNKFIGRCGFHTWYVPHSRAEIGYQMNSDADKKMGYMSEAMCAILAYGFRELGLNRVEAFVGRHNPASQRLLEKFGFKLEGVMREHYCKNGVIEDSLCYSLLKNEYRPT